LKLIPSWLSSLFTRATAQPVGHPRDPVVAAWFGGGTSVAGVHVDADSAMRVNAVYACVSLISEMIASLPLHVYRDAGDGTPAKAKEHKLYRLLHDEPVPGRLTSFEWRETMLTWCLLRGDAYARVTWTGGGTVKELRPMHPNRVTIVPLAGGKVAYDVRHRDGRVERLRDWEMLRIPYKLVEDDECQASMTPVAVHRQTIGMTMASQRYLSAFYANSASPKGGLKIPNVIGDEAAQKIRDSWERRHQGPENAGKLAILDGGVEWTPLGMTMDDAQYVDLQKLSLEDIARIFLVPGHKIGIMTASTNNNIEHQAIQFVTDTLNRWCKRIEQRMNMTLLSQLDRAAGYSIGFDLKGLMAGDSQARANFYKALFYLGALSPNEIRNLEGFSSYAGGERFFVQGASVPMDRIDDHIGDKTPENMPATDANVDPAGGENDAKEAA